MKAVLSRQFSSLTNYNYRVYFFGQMVSLIGTWMQTTGQAWLVLKLTGSANSLGLVVALQFLAAMPFQVVFERARETGALAAVERHEPAHIETHQRIEPRVHERRAATGQARQQQHGEQGPCDPAAQVKVRLG